MFVLKNNRQIYEEKIPHAFPKLFGKSCVAIPHLRRRPSLPHIKHIMHINEMMQHAKSACGKINTVAIRRLLLCLLLAKENAQNSGYIFSKFVVNANFDLVTDYILRRAVNDDSIDVGPLLSEWKCFEYILRFQYRPTRNRSSNHLTKKPKTSPSPWEMWTTI